MGLFFTDEELGGCGARRRSLLRQIEELYGKIDSENEKRDGLLADLRRTEREIERWESLVRDMEAYLQ